MTGFEICMRDGPIGAMLSPRIGPKCLASLDEVLAKACRSATAQKVPFAPWKTQTFCVESASYARKASYSFRAVRGSTAFRRELRFKVIVVMPSGEVAYCTSSDSESDVEALIVTRRVAGYNCSADDGRAAVDLVFTFSRCRAGTYLGTSNGASLSLNHLA